MSLKTFIYPFLNLLILEVSLGWNFGDNICPCDMHDLGR
jgi:hypothetical protein